MPPMFLKRVCKESIFFYCFLKGNVFKEYLVPGCGLYSCKATSPNSELRRKLTVQQENSTLELL
jgi:hypothetical protein